MQVITKTIDVAGQTITITELTTGALRAMLARVAEKVNKGDYTAVDVELIPGADLFTLGYMTDIKDVDLFTPSQLAAVAEKCREVNPHFFAMRGRLMEMGRRIMAAQDETSNDPSLH